MGKEVCIGADHAGFELKERIKKWLADSGWKVEDVGALGFGKDDDYPVYAEKLGRIVARRKTMGILFCGSGLGMCIAVNKIKGVRGIAVSDEEGARTSREHNDANVLCLGGRILGEKSAKKIIETWLNTKFSGEERHKRRLALIQKIEKGGRL